MLDPPMIAAGLEPVGREPELERLRAFLEAASPSRALVLTGGPGSARRRVGELAAGGSSNKEIALTLFVSVRTVEAHLTSAYAKLGVRSRAQLARRLDELP
jgi:DNA-binding NarL/FixJ family response regulator